MTKYIDAEKLIAEIERYIKHYENLDRNDFKNGELYICQELLSFVKSLQQEQPIQVNTLTWKDINDLERIINNVHYEFRAGIGEKSFGEEVLERFREERDEQEQPKVDLEKEIDAYLEPIKPSQIQEAPFTSMENIARHFYELGLNARKEE